ncbi:MAG TPA: hypothetical protein VLH75_08560 [Longimicrobiales bacterium]|nr:hypothetical protein [Longimicrobiales bacterium]
MSYAPLLDARVWRLLEKDGELAAEARGKDCACGGRLHRARYRRKPRRGVPEELRGEYGWRESLCCEREGCRKRVMPASVRCMGRCVYLAALLASLTGAVS